MTGIEQIENMTKVRKIVKAIISIASDNDLVISVPIKPFENINTITIDLTENNIKFN